MVQHWIDRKNDPKWATTEGLWLRHGTGQLWFSVRFINLESQGGQGMVCEAAMVSLNDVPRKDLLAAAAVAKLKLDDPQPQAELEMQLVEALLDYGVYAPLLIVTTTDSPEVTQMHVMQSVNRMISHPEELNAVLDTPANVVGTTARELGQGNMMAGLDRYIASIEKTGEAPDGQMNTLLQQNGVDVVATVAKAQALLAEESKA